MGEIAALTTAFCWAASSIFFTSASKDAGSINVNRIRLLMAVIILILIHLVFTGQVLPLQAEPYRWVWLSLSGIIGLVLGDTALFQVFITIGNRLGTLLMVTVPVMSSLLAWLLIGETLKFVEVGGIALCILGISLVVLDRRNGEGAYRSRKQYAWGILLALISALCQAAGLTLAKKGLGGDFSPLSAVVIRMLAAMVTLWFVTLLLGKTRSTFHSIFNAPKTVNMVILGTLVGPVLGVWLSLVAVQVAYVGIASTLMSLTPIIILPVARWWYKENVSRRAVLGTVVALAGVALIFLVP
jgi:drug/metabolite transporter (DMT)-like permease